MKTLLLGILVIVIVGIGGLVYRNALEHPSQPIACPLDALLCPDGTSVARTGSTCTFALCPPPNVSLASVGISFALPAGFAPIALPDTQSVAAYQLPAVASTSESADIIIRQYAITGSTTILAVIQKSAISGTSGEPVKPTSFTATTLSDRNFTIVSIERFEGVIDTAYYLRHGDTVLRFDAIDRGADWTNPNLNVNTLPAHAALIKLLTSLQGQ